MAAVLPAVGLHSGNLVTFMRKQLGMKVNGDMELHILGEMPIKVAEVLPATNTTTLAQNAGFSAPDVTTISNVLTTKKIKVNKDTKSNPATPPRAGMWPSL